MPVTVPRPALVIQQRRSPWWWVRLWVAVLLGLVLAFFAGRLEDRFARRQLTHEQERLEARVRDLETQLQTVQRERTVIEQARQVDELAGEELRGTLKTLQDRVREVEKENEFYRGIMNPAGEKSGLQIDSVNVVAYGSEDRYRVRAILTQLRRHDRNAKGRLQLSIVGEGGSIEVFPGQADAGKAGSKTRSGTNSSTGGSGAADSSVSANRFDFQYFQNLETDVQLPAGFRPREIRVIATPDGAGARSIERVFPWPINATAPPATSGMQIPSGMQAPSGVPAAPAPGSEPAAAPVRASR